MRRVNYLDWRRLSQRHAEPLLDQLYGDTDVGVFRCQQGGSLSPSDPIDGIAANHPHDANIVNDPDVILATGSEAENWTDEWTSAGDRDVIDTVDSDPVRRFSPLAGKALRVKIASEPTRTR